MSRKRPSFPQEWWEDLGKFLQENSELGFTKDQQREFMMWLVNSFIENDQVILPQHKAREIFKEAGAEDALNKTIEKDED